MASISDRCHNFIDKAKLVHGNKYNYDKVEYKAARTKVKIFCKIPDHGVFEQTPDNHTRGKGQGCPKCGNIKQGVSKRLTLTEFIEKAKEKHGDKYDYSESVYIGNHKNLKIKCKEPNHGEFEQTPSSHIIGSGCPKCSNIKKSLLFRSTIEEFIEKAKEIHGDKYDYNKSVYVNTNTKMIIKCKEPNHGEFEQTPSSHIIGSGCPKCSNIKKSLSRKYTLQEFIEKSKETHGEKYDYSKSQYIDSQTKVIIICREEEHGEFLQTPTSHMQEHGCPKCSYLSTGLLNGMTLQEFIEKANIVHNNKYDYSNSDYVISHRHIKIICPKHGEFKQRPSNHIQGRGCTKCNIGTSKNSIEWLNMIKVNYPELRTYDSIEGEYRIPTTNYSADGYDEKTNTVFEFHGDYWHGNPLIFQSDQINQRTKCTFGELYNKTLYKRKILEELGYKYIEVWENDWNTLKRVILKKQRSIKIISKNANEF
jgi:hypothetical protein